MICKKHLTYKAIYKPRVDCKMCERMFQLARLKRLRNIMETEWQNYLQRKALRAIKRAKTKETKNKMVKTMKYKLISPKGKRYTTDNLTRFARKFKLTRTGLSKIVNGHQNSHRNWTAA